MCDQRNLVFPFINLSGTLWVVISALGQAQWFSSGKWKPCRWKELNSKWAYLHGGSCRAIQRPETLKSLQIPPLDPGFRCFSLSMCSSANKKEHNPIASNPLGLSEETNASLHIIRQLGVLGLLGTQNLNDASSTFRRYKLKRFVSSSDPLTIYEGAFLIRISPQCPFGWWPRARLALQELPPQTAVGPPRTDGQFNIHT